MNILSKLYKKLISPHTQKRSTVRFYLIALIFIFVTTLVLLWLIITSRVGATYQGDEGLRIFDIYQTSRGYSGRLYGGIWESFRDTFWGFHAPGDWFIRSSFIRILDLVGIESNPVKLMFGLSLFMGMLTHLFLVRTCYRASGALAGLVCLFIFVSSYVLTDIRLSSVGESISIPLIVIGIFSLQSGTMVGERPWLKISIGACFILLAALTRPDTAFILPGLCLALWYIFGFKKATLFGCIAGSYDIAKIVNSTFFANNDKLTLLNVGEKYFNPAHSLKSFLNTDYFQTFIHEPNFAILTIGFLGGLYCIFKPSDREIEQSTLILLMACFFSYTVVIIISQFSGLAPHASYRMAITSTLFIVPIFAIVCRRIHAYFDGKKSPLSKNSPVEKVPYGTIIVTLFCGWGVYYFSTDVVQRASTKVPSGVVEAISFTEGRMSEKDGLFIDRMQFWESAMPAYIADRPTPLCQYARCQISMAPAEKLWSARRTENPIAGTRTYGEFNALRMHTFISQERPTYILIANERVRKEWYRKSTGIFKEDVEIWYSAIYPYLIDDIDYNKLSPVFMKLGTIDQVNYFDDYVYLIPRRMTDVAIVYQAYYGRSPEQ